MSWNSPGKNTEVVAIPFSRGSSWSRDWTWVSHIVGRFFTVSGTIEVPHLCQSHLNKVVFKTRRTAHRRVDRLSESKASWKPNTEKKLRRLVIEKQAAAEKKNGLLSGQGDLGRAYEGTGVSQVLHQTHVCRGLSRLKMLLPPSLPDSLGRKRKKYRRRVGATMAGRMRLVS